MNNKKIISLILCWMLVIVSGLCVLSFADIESGSNSETEQHYEKANELYKLADYDAAITEFEAIISQSPNSVIAYNAQYWIGQIYFETGQFDTALSTFQKLIDEYPTSIVVPATNLMIERVQQAQKNQALFEAVQNGDLEQVKLLISQGADFNIKGTNPRMGTLLGIAVSGNHKDIAELLIDNGADASGALQSIIFNYELERELGRVSEFNKNREGEETHYFSKLFL